MKVLNINKTNILHDFKRLSNIWDSTENITLQLDIKQSETKTVVRALTSYLPNDLAYSIMSEIAENEKLDDDLMQLIFEKGDKGCKIAICLHEDLPQELKERCVQSADIDIKEHYMQGNVNSRSLNTLYYTDLQLIISLFICIFLQVFVPLQYKTCRNIC